MQENELPSSGTGSAGRTGSAGSTGSAGNTEVQEVQAVYTLLVDLEKVLCND